MNFQVAFSGVLGLYLVATALYLMRLVLGRPILSALALRVCVVAAITQFGVLVGHFATMEGPLFASYLDFYQVSALVLALTFIFLAFTKRFYAAGPLFVTVIDVLCFLSLTHDSPYAYKGIQIAGSDYLALHLILISLSLAIFAIGLISAVMFLIAEYQIKKKTFSGWMAKLPSLEVLEGVHHKALLVGFGLFTLAILAGAGFSKMATGQYIFADPKVYMSYCLWGFFALLLNLRSIRGWQGRRGVMLSLVGFCGLGFLFWVGLA